MHYLQMPIAMTMSNEYDVTIVIGGANEDSALTHILREDETA